MPNKTGDFLPLQLTNAGRDMLTQGRAGHVLTFTKVAIGDGTATGTAIDNLTALKGHKLYIPIAKNETVHAGQMRLQFRVNNKVVTSGFYFREIGLMAKVDNGEEKLYAYTTCGDKARMIYDNTYPIQERVVNIDTVTDNAVNVRVILDWSIVYATQKDVFTTLEKVYPIGSIYTSVVSTNPSILFGFGTWEALPEGRMLLSQSNEYPAGTTGGEAMHTLTASEMPRHNHYDNTEIAGNHNHNRGDMNIKGAFWATVGRTNGASGAISMTGEEGQGYTQWYEGYYDGRVFELNAANNWTGNTNTTGDHTHAIKNDGGSQPHNNMPPYLSVYMWKRTA